MYVYIYILVAYTTSVITHSIIKDNVISFDARCWAGSRGTDKDATGRAEAMARGRSAAGAWPPTEMT